MTTTRCSVLGTLRVLVVNVTFSLNTFEVLFPSGVTGLKSMANAQAPALVKEVPAVQSSLEAPSGKSVGYVSPENCSEALPMFSTSTVFGLSRLVEPSFVESNFNDGGSARSIFNHRNQGE